MASDGKYEDFKAICVDYQTEEYQFIGYKNVGAIFHIIRETCIALKENDTIFTEDNYEINLTH